MELPRSTARRDRGSAQPSRYRTGALPLLLVAASPAAGRLMLEPALLVERLLPRSEDELLPAVPTLDTLVTLHHEASEGHSPEKARNPWRVSNARGKGVTYNKALTNEELVGTMRECLERGFEVH